MKTFIIVLISICVASMNLKAQDTQNEIKPDSAKTDSSKIKKQLKYKTTNTFRFGSKEIWVVVPDDASNDNKNAKQRFNGHLEGLELGFNGFDKPDYSMYNGNEFMGLNQSKSMEVNLNFHKVNIGLYKSYIGIVSGLGLSYNNYRFEGPYTIVKGSQVTEPVLLEMENLSKTKLAVSYLQVPLLLEFQVPVNNKEGRLFFNAGVIGGVKISSHTKVKYGDAKDKDHSEFNINSFKYAATARIGYKKIGLFGTYSLTPLFESGKGPELTPFTIGISFFDL